MVLGIILGIGMIIIVIIHKESKDCSIRIFNNVKVYVSEKEICCTWSRTVPPGIYNAEQYENYAYIFFRGHFVRIEEKDYEVLPLAEWKK
jgi:hypothetical protein